MYTEAKAGEVRIVSVAARWPSRRAHREVMRFEYDKEANALYIYLRGKIPAGGVARTVELAPGVYLDADRAGRILGVEFLDFADFRGFLERNGGRVDIPVHIGDLDASKPVPF
jgi:uncharacterized protein YuzE